MGLSETAVLNFETNLDKVAREAVAAAAGQRQFAKAVKDSLTAEEAAAAFRARTAAKIRREQEKTHREFLEQKQKERDLLVENTQRLAAYALAIGGALKAVDALSARSLQLEDVHRNLPFSLDRAAKATGGLVDQYTLMQKAVQANTLGAAKTSKEYEKLVTVATKLARAQGQDATKGVEDLTTALARGSFQIADNLGISLTAAEAERMYAEHLGVTRKRLLDSQKAESKRFGILQKGIEAAEGVTVAEEGWALEIQKTKVQVMDAADNLLTLTSRLEAFTKRLSENHPHLTAFGDGVQNLLAAGLDGVTSSAVVQLAEGVNALTDATGAPVVEASMTKLEDLTQKIGNQARVAGQEYMDLAIAITAAANLDATVEKLWKKHRPRGRRDRGRNLDAEDAFNRNADSALMELRQQSGDVAGGINGFSQTATTDARFDDMRARSEAANDLLVEQAVRQRELRLEQLEIDRELGLTPAAQAQIEADIAAAHHEKMLQLQRQHVADKRSVDKAAFDARLTQIRAEKAAEREKIQSFRQGFQIYKSVQDNTMSLASEVLASTSMSAERQARIANRFRGVQVLGGAVQETFEAIAAAARYDFGAAALHGTAAAFGYVKGPLLLSGALDPSGGGSGGGGGSRGGGPTPITGEIGENTRGSRPGGPVSRPRTAANTSPQGGQGAPSGSTGGRTVNVNIGTVETLATNEEELGLKIRKVVQKSEATHGEAA